MTTSEKYQEKMDRAWDLLHKENYSLAQIAKELDVSAPQVQALIGRKSLQLKEMEEKS